MECDWLMTSKDILSTDDYKPTSTIKDNFVVYDTSSKLEVCLLTEISQLVEDMLSSGERNNACLNY